MVDTILTIIATILVSILFVVVMGIFVCIPIVLGATVNPAWTLLYCITLPCANFLWDLID